MPAELEKTYDWLPNSVLLEAAMKRQLPDRIEDPSNGPITTTGNES